MLIGTTSLVAFTIFGVMTSPIFTVALSIYGIVKSVQILAQIIIPLCYEFKAKPLPAITLSSP
jgi:hypothetical protein